MRTPSLAIPLALVGMLATGARADHTRNILLVGYWPPSNEMLRPFSTSPEQNPDGWIGHNWEGRGYNIYSYFPEFPNGLGQGVGDFEVDYQDSSEDWARVTRELHPVAIITFSRSNTIRGWELEPAHQRFRLPGESSPKGRNVPFYTQDYTAPRYPVNVPIADEQVGNIRTSALPMGAIVQAVSAQLSPSLIDPFIPPYDPNNPDTYDFGGSFLSGFMGYMGLWYHDQHMEPDDRWRCAGAGHIHVGMATAVPVGVAATQITLRVLIDHVTAQIPFCPADFNRDDIANTQDFFDYLAAFLGHESGADVNKDSVINSQDFFDFITAFMIGCP